MEVTLAALTAIPEGEGRTFVVGKAKLAVFRGRQGELYATQADCPHKGGMLADGLLGSGTLVCPLHAQKFDLATGRALNGECNLKTYPARLDATGQIVVVLNERELP
jgi:nitrite reductase (NADH) small subunit